MRTPLKKEETVGLSEIPLIIHYIWFGSTPSTEQVANLKRCQQMNDGFIHLLWTDTIENKTLLQSVFHKSGIIVENIAEEITLKHNLLKNSGPEQLKNYRLIRYHLADKNYWAASDVLRIDLIAIFGGYYFDVDVIPKLPLIDLIHTQKKFIPAAIILFAFNKNCIKNTGFYSFMGACSKHPLFLLAQTILPMLDNLVEQTQWKDKPITNYPVELIARHWLASIFSIPSSLPAITNLQKAIHYNTAMFLTGQALFIAIDFFEILYALFSKNKHTSIENLAAHFKNALKIFSPTPKTSRKYFTFPGISYSEMQSRIQKNPVATLYDIVFYSAIQKSEETIYSYIALWMVCARFGAYLFLNSTDSTVSNNVTTAKLPLAFFSSLKPTDEKASDFHCLVLD